MTEDREIIEGLDRVRADASARVYPRVSCVGPSVFPLPEF
jgi:hypothetical protein